MLDTFTTDTFAGRLGETFRIVPEGRPEGRTPVVAVLAEVTPLGRSATGRSVAGSDVGRPEAFSLVFRAPRDAQLAQRIHRLEHDALGAFELFLVPIGLDAEGMRYEAVFT